MGLYLCVFDESGDEIEGVEVGSYADFGDFRDAVTSLVEGGSLGGVCPVLTTHADSDGEWSSEEAKQLYSELTHIAEVFSKQPPVDFNVRWKLEAAKTFGLKPMNLGQCFFDVDGEELTERLKQLAKASIASGMPINFQ